MDYKSYGIFSFFSVYPQKQYLNQIRLSLNAGIRDAYFEDIVQDRWVRANLQFRFTEFNQMFVSYRNDMEKYEGVDFHKNTISIEGQNNLIKWMPFGLVFQTGSSIYYDPEDPFLGRSNVYGIFVELKPDKRLRLGVEFTKQTFWKKRGGEMVFDYNHFYKEIYGSFLISFILKPGTVFFLGADNNLLRDEFERYGQTNYSVFLKFSYWWRI